MLNRRRWLCSIVLGLGFLLGGNEARAEVVINEIMYNTPGNPDVEYVELINTGPGSVNLTGWYLVDDDDINDRCFLAGTLLPGEYWVVPGRLDLFSIAFPDVTQVNPNEFDSPTGATGFGLGNTTDTVRLFDGSNALIDDVAYADAAPWPTTPDGLGPSLELLSPLLDNAAAANWGASANGPPRGTPGAENSIFIPDLPPEASAVSRDIPLPGASDTVTVTVFADDDLGLAMVELFVDTGSDFVPQPMLDDGLSGDGAPSDGIFGTTILPQPTGTLVRYYVQATDSLAQTVELPAGAPAEFLAYTTDYVPPRLRVNEVLASNQNGISDGAGDEEDWVEILNLGPTTVDLTGMFLSDRLDETTAWEFPGLSVGPGGSALIWCDDEPGEGALHATFRLSRSGGEIGLFDSVEHGNVLIHGYTFGVQSPDIAFGFVADSGDAPEYLVPPTPLAGNASSSTFSDICINEFLADSQIPGVPDWIEIFNRGTTTVDIGGWHLSDDVDDPRRYAFPQPTTIAPGGHLSVDSNALGFGLTNSGERAMLSDPSGLIGYDYIEFGPQFTDVSYGRVADGTPNWHLLTPASRDLPNVCDTAIAGPSPIEALIFDHPASLTWTALPGAAAYDTLRGDLDALRGSGGSFAVSFPACVDDNNPTTASWVPVVPASGQAFYYLVRGVNFSCGFGTYDSGSPLQTESRDGSLAASGATCP